MASSTESVLCLLHLAWPKHLSSMENEQQALPGETLIAYRGWRQRRRGGGGRLHLHFSGRVQFVHVRDNICNLQVGACMQMRYRSANKCAKLKHRRGWCMARWADLDVHEQEAGCDRNALGPAQGTSKGQQGVRYATTNRAPQQQCPRWSATDGGAWAHPCRPENAPVAEPGLRMSLVWPENPVYCSTDCSCVCPVIRMSTFS